jgi:DNA-binding MarR family transcriptional regulator
LDDPVIATPAPTAVRVERVALLAGSLGSHATAAMTAALGDMEITETRGVLVLCELARSGPLRPREIQAMTGLTSGGTTNLLDRLARLDLVARSHDLVEGDRRAVVVGLAPRGREVVEVVMGVFAQQAGAIRSFLLDLDAELGGAAAHSGLPADGGRSDSSEPDGRLLDAVAGLARLGIALRNAMVAGFEHQEVFGNETAVILGTLLHGGPRRPRDLQSLVPLTSGGLTKLLARLESVGLVTLDRHRLAADRRATIVSITAAGRRAMTVAGATLAERRDEIRGLIREAADLLGA